MDSHFEESWFYAPLSRVGDRTELSEDEAFHIRKVLRIKSGTTVVAANGRGGVYVCDTRITQDTVELTAREARVADAAASSPPLLNFVLSLLKGKDLEEPVEALCQLPVRSIQLVTTDFTQEFKGQDHARLIERLKAKSLVGLKQAKKPWLTEINAPMPLRDWRKKNTADALVLLHPGPDALPARPQGAYHVLTGPEGGFSESELQWLLEDEKSLRMGLGNTRIRGVHAPLLACGKLMGLGWL